MLVKEVMTPEAEWVDPETTLLDAAKRMRDKDIGSLLVGEHDKIIGMVTDRDIACRGIARNLNPAKTPVRKVMSERIIWCFDDQEIENAANLMEKKKVRRLAVMNREADGPLARVTAAYEVLTSHRHSARGKRGCLLQSLQCRTAELPPPTCRHCPTSSDSAASL